MKIHGPEKCEIACTGCEGFHHFIDDGFDPENPLEMLTKAEQSALAAGHAEAFYSCKHCDEAWAEMEDSEDEHDQTS